MKSKAWLVGMFMGVILLQAGMVHATKTEVIVKAENKADFAAVALAVQGQMKPGGRYGFMDAKEQDEVNSGLSYMQSLFDKYNTVDQMDQQTKVDLFNHQEAVNAILTRRDNNRLVCENVAPVGSHITRTTCRTYGEIQQDHRDTQQMLDNMKRVQTLRGGN
ncbi:hypothetical protein [Rhodanobacter sp. B04]|uniref:hypothetical protein n=1 Tax=Rhodanobacter sp. B04 TaxID=1945860 RepID=UPI00111561AF|nr:hypothetical protein [Rhodanobacter sp. B04]